MTRRQELIRELVEDLSPSRRLAPARAAALGWLAAAALLVGAATLASGPLRPGALGQLVSDPRFALDVALGGAAAVAAILGLARLRVPSLAPARRRAAPALALLLAWLAFQPLGLLAREAPSSTLGARPLCWLQVLLFSLAPLAAALLLARRAAPLERAWTGVLAGLAAGALGALAMQLGCQNDPLHALAAHLAPAVGVTMAGALLGRFALRPV